MNQELSPSYYAVIPANVRYAKIPPNAKLLYGEITALCNDKGYCWATNKYFAELYDKTESTISVWVSALENGGFISVVIEDYNTRKIYLKVAIHEGGVLEKSKGGIRKIERGVLEKSKEQNNTFNTTSINKDFNFENREPNAAHVNGTIDNQLDPKVIANQIQTSTAPIDPGGDEWGAKTEKRSHRSSGEAVGASTPRPHSQKVTKEEREAAFRKQAETYIGKYDEEMITAFCDYWTESNPTGLKLKFELQKIFDISRRLATWDKNNINRKWKTSSAINTSPDLDNYDLPPDLLTKYNNYLESVQQNFPALLKSNCRIYSKDDFFDLSTDRTVTARRNRITDRKYQELWIQAHRDLVEKPYLRTQNATVYEYTRKLMRQELEYA